MTADLALTLSFEGIGLLTRVPGGWHLLGEVGLDSPDLAADLADLRVQAVAVGGEDFTTTLVLPNDQIKYLTLPAGRMTGKKRRHQAEEALEDATPYRADQLIFDITTLGPTPQIAAVARDTLDEAEAFAVEHAFNPIGFTAIPSKELFAGAPDFGGTAQARAAGIKIKADKSTILVVGEGPLPEPTPEPVPESPSLPIEPAPQDSPAKDAEPKPEADVATPQVIQPSDATPKEPTPEAEPAVPPPAAEEQTAKPKTSDSVAPESGKSHTKSDDKAKDKPIKKTAKPAAAFASIRAQKTSPDTKAAPELSGVSRKVSGTNAPSIPTDTGDSNTPPLRFDPAKAVAGLKTGNDTPEAKTQNRVASDGDEAETATFASARSKTKIAGPAPRSGKKVVTTKPKKASAKDKQKIAMFGVRPEEVRGKPKHLGLILTAILFVFLAIVALWASMTMEDGLAGLFGTDEPEIAQVTDASATAQVDGSAEGIADTTEPAQAPAPEQVASGEENVTVEPAPPPADAPMVVTVPDGMTPNPGDEVETALLEPLAPDSITDSAEIETMLDQVGDGNIDPVEAESRYAVTGIWQRAPLSPNELSSDSSNDIYIASVDRDTIGFDAVALAAPDSLDTDKPARAQVNPVAADTTFDLDDRGLVVATAEGALNPEGIMVFAGRPPVVPAAYPKRIKVGEEPQLSDADNSRLATLRPKMRPNNLKEQNERATYGGLTLTELAGRRPKLRPENVKLADEKDLTPTQYAVKASPRPRLKPANIAQLAARANPSENTTAAVAVPAAAAVVPDIPTTASVARQATIKNAINLNKVNLIGVYGTSSNRRALVRLSSGRYKKVQVGDRVDGGRVSAISEDELHYTKGKRNLVLKMPKG